MHVPTATREGRDRVKTDERAGARVRWAIFLHSQSVSVYSQITHTDIPKSAKILAHVSKSKARQARKGKAPSKRLVVTLTVTRALDPAGRAEVLVAVAADADWARGWVALRLAVVADDVPAQAAAREEIFCVLSAVGAADGAAAVAGHQRVTAAAAGVLGRVRADAA